MTPSGCRSRLFLLLASALCHCADSVRLNSERAGATNGGMQDGVLKVATRDAQQHRSASKKTTVLFYGDSILRFAAEDLCKHTSSELWESIGGIRQEEFAGPRICNLKNSDTLLLFFFSYGFGYDLPLTHGYPNMRHSQLPPNSKEALELIKTNLTNLGIKIDAFFLESNLWDVQRHNEFFPKKWWNRYVSEWKANATQMIQLVDTLFPESKHMWISSCISEEDTRKAQSESLNRAARTILPERWNYIDVESLLHRRPYYRDTWHLAPGSTIPLMKLLLERAA